MNIQRIIEEELDRVLKEGPDPPAGAGEAAPTAPTAEIGRAHV